MEPHVVVYCDDDEGVCVYRVPSKTAAVRKLNGRKGAIGPCNEADRVAVSCSTLEIVSCNPDGTFSETVEVHRCHKTRFGPMVYVGVFGPQ